MAHALLAVLANTYVSDPHQREASAHSHRNAYEIVRTSPTNGNLISRKIAPIVGGSPTIKANSGKFRSGEELSVIAERTVLGAPVTATGSNASTKSTNIIIRPTRQFLT